MADPLLPDDVAQRTFGQRLRGYDPQEVQAFLDEVASSLREARSEVDALRTRLLELGNLDLSAEFDTVREDVGRVLHTAREAAEGMRKRAAVDAEAIVEAAQEAAVQLRTDAWTTAEKLLADSTAEAETITQAAEREALAIIGEAERETHRRQTALRREAEESIRAAKLEAERVLMDARARSDQMIQEATREVAAAENRAASIEKRRTEMLAELETARETIRKLEIEIEQRREALAGPSPEEVESSTVKVLAPKDEDADGGETVWADGSEIVKIVRPPKRIVEPAPEPVDAEAMAAEVARLRTNSEAEGVAALIGEEEPGEPEGPGDVPETAEGGAEAVEEAVGEAVQAEAAPVSELDDLFARLREVESEQPEEVTREEPAEQSEPVIEKAPRGVWPAGLGDPFDLRDRLLLPVTNRVLRTVKKELTEAQNIALEELRIDSASWEPTAETLAGRLGECMQTVVRDSYAAGVAAAAETTESQAEVPEGKEDSKAAAVGFAQSLTEAVSSALAEARADGQGPRQLAASLSRVYRAWRTDEAERRARDIASGAYHRGFLAGLGAAGVPDAAWVVAGRGCATCRAAAEAGSVTLGAAFEGPITEPPAHDDCGCTLVAG